jgi:hypothetical protein
MQIYLKGNPANTDSFPIHPGFSGNREDKLFPACPIGLQTIYLKVWRLGDDALTHQKRITKIVK